MARKVHKVKEVSQRLALLQDPHIEFVLQRACSGAPKFSYLLRTVDTTPWCPSSRTSTGTAGTRSAGS